MKKLFTLLFALMASIGTLFARGIQIGDLYFLLNDEWNTAEVTYQSYSPYSSEYNKDWAIETVSIPETVTYENVVYRVTTIGSFAFENCQSLSSVIIPNGVIYINSNAFGDCPNLVSVIIPNSVETIAELAFYECTSLIDLNIPSSVSDIRGNAFLKVPNVLYEGSATGSPWGAKNINCYGDGWFVYNDESKTQLLACASIANGEITISKTVQEIKESTFEGLGHITSITIPDGVTSIKDNTFSKCSGLISVTIPNTVDSIGERAFYSCKGLTSVEIPNSVRSIGEQAFWYCKSLTSVEMPDSIKSIESETFLECSSLTSINIPESVISIGSSAFSGCYALTSVEIPNSITTIGNKAFSGVPNIVYNGPAIGSPWGAKCLNGVVDGYLVFSDETKKVLCACSASAPDSISIPEGVTTIKNAAFSGCNNVRNIAFPATITTIGSSIFSGSYERKIHITDLTKWCSINFESEWTYYANLCLNGEVIKDLVLPENVTEISDYAFFSMDSIVSVTFPNSLKKIGVNAFYGCNLITLDIPDNVETIGNSAFIWCRNLENVTIGGGVKNFGNDVFYADTKISSVTLKEGITEIGREAFEACSGLTSIVIPNSVKTIQNGAFYLCSNLSSVILGNGLTGIYMNAFSCCRNLQSIVIPDGVKSISEKAFYNCRGLKEVILSENLTYIDKNAFEWCDSLTSISIPKGVKTIKEYAFKNCSSLKLIYVKNPVPANIYSTTFTGISEEHIVYVPYGRKYSYLNANYWKDMNIEEAYSIETHASPTSASITFSHYVWELNDDYVASVGIEGGETFDGNTIEQTGLEPNSENNDISIVLTSQRGETDIINVSFKTTELTLTTQPSKAVSETVAILLAETNMSNAETNCGFEWKRNEMPEDYTPTKVYCPVANGTMAGRLKNLKDNVLYKCRAFYQSTAGNMYYGDWQYVFTGDVTVEFDPIIYTYGATIVRENEATISGYALAGSEDFTEQGFEYWAESRVPRSGDAPLHMPAAYQEDLGMHHFIQAKGISMQVTLTNLDPGTVYKYRAYATVGNDTITGAEMSFSTQGIYYEPSYVITFVNWDGEILQSSSIETGTMPEYTGAEPVRPNDGEYTYVFSGWSPELAIVIEAATYTAQFIPSEATAISNTSADQLKTTKLFRNNQILILRGEKVYTITGQEVR